MRRRQLAQPSSLITLVDVLFVLTFAALVQAAAARDQAAASAAVDEPEVAVPVVDAGVDAPDAAPPVRADVAALRDRALADLTAQLAGRPAVVARVSRDGVLTALELPDRTIDLGVPLLERVPEPDIVVAYLGDRSAELRVCRIATLRMGVPDLSGYLVIVAPEVPLADLTVALVAGLRRDAERCLSEQRGAAVLVDQGVVP